MLFHVKPVKGMLAHVWPVYCRLGQIRHVIWG